MPRLTLYLTAAQLAALYETLQLASRVSSVSDGTFVLVPGGTVAS